MQKSILRRSLTSLLALVMVASLFTVCGFGAMAETTELKLKAFGGEALFEAAEGVGNTNDEDMPIYTSFQDVIGRVSVQPDNFMFHSVGVRHSDSAENLAYKKGDQLEFVVRLMADESYSSGTLFEYEFAFDAFKGRDDLIYMQQIDEAAYDAAETKTDAITGVSYKEFSLVCDLEHDDFNDPTKEGQIRAMAKNAAPVTVYFWGAYNKTTQTTIVEYEGNSLGAQAGSQGYYENVYDGPAVGIASYASDHGQATGRDWHLAPYCFNAFGADRDNPVLLLDRLGASLPAGNYSLGIEMSTMVALGTLDKCLVTVYDGTKKLNDMVVTEAMVNAAAGKDTGIFAEYRMDFTVPEESAGKEITFSIQLFDSNDIKIRNVSYYTAVDASATMPEASKNVQDMINGLTIEKKEAIQAARAELDKLDIIGQAWVGEEALKKLESYEKAQADAAQIMSAITALGNAADINVSNYAEKTQALNNAEKAYNQFVALYGEEDSAKLITNAADLKAVREAYNAAKSQDQERLDAIAAVEKLIDAIGDVTKDNFADKLEAIETAEAARDKLLADYNQATVDAVSNLNKLTQAREKYDEYVAMPDVVYGDVDDDGDIDPTDALKVLQHTVDLAKLEGDRFTAADVDGNKDVNATDALYILQYVVEIIDTFPVEK